MHMSNNIVQRLQASVRYGAVHGAPEERVVCAAQMREAAAEIERLRVELHMARQHTEVPRCGTCAAWTVHHPSLLSRLCMNPASENYQRGLYTATHGCPAWQAKAEV